MPKVIQRQTEPLLSLPSLTALPSQCVSSYQSSSGLSACLHPNCCLGPKSLISPASCPAPSLAPVPINWNRTPPSWPGIHSGVEQLPSKARTLPHIRGPAPLPGVVFPWPIDSSPLDLSELVGSGSPAFTCDAPLFPTGSFAVPWAWSIRPQLKFLPLRPTQQSPIAWPSAQSSVVLSFLMQPILLTSVTHFFFCRWKESS